MPVNSDRAFPRAGCTYTEDHGDDAFAQDGMDLRTYMAAHAPECPAWDFEPVMPSARPQPVMTPGAECANDREIYDWDRERNKQLAIQWPWVWADAVLAARDQQPAHAVIKSAVPATSTTTDALLTECCVELAELYRTSKWRGGEIPECFARYMQARFPGCVDLYAAMPRIENDVRTRAVIAIASTERQNASLYNALAKLWLVAHKSELDDALIAEVKALLGEQMKGGA